jgi:type IV secretory pathway VirB3-like protein
MRHFAIICVLLFVVAQLAWAADDGVIESTKASQDMAPSTDPAVPFWQVARPV